MVERKRLPEVEPLRFDVWPDESTYTPNDTCRWYASCDIDGTHYETSSRRGPTLKLARVLVAENIPDAPVLVYERDSKEAEPKPYWSLRYRSFHNDMAPFTLAESANSPLRKGKYVDPAVRTGAVAADE